MQEPSEKAKKKALGLYKTPFWSDHLDIYIFDVDYNTVADNMVEDPELPVRVRGWGKISSRFRDPREAGEVQDAVSWHLKQCLRPGMTREETVRALNEYWEKA